MTVFAAVVAIVPFIVRMVPAAIVKTRAAPPEKLTLYKACDPVMVCVFAKWIVLLPEFIIPAV